MWQQLTMRWPKHDICICTDPTTRFLSGAMKKRHGAHHKRAQMNDTLYLAFTSYQITIPCAHLTHVSTT